jgi:hypothetical protein
VGDFFGENILKIITSVPGLPDGTYVYLHPKLFYFYKKKLFISVVIGTAWNGKILLRFTAIWYILWPRDILCSFGIFYHFGML